MRSNLRIWMGAVVSIGCLGAAACGSSTPSEPSADRTNVPSPQGDLYQPPEPLEPAPPGTLIWAEPVAGLEDLQPPASVWRILYHSRSRDDRDIAVSGFAVVPTSPVPDDGRPVFAWAHGTVGLGDQCAPSHDVREHLPPYGGQQIERGTVLVATDYEGLGTPGVPTSTVAAAEAHAMLDSVRALTSLPNVGTLGDVLLAGHSQGGRAALFAAELGPQYAPELNLVGAAALALAGAELPSLVDHLADSPYKGAVLMGAIGLRASYSDLDLSTVFTPAAIADVKRVETECVGDTIGRYQTQDTGDSISQLPSRVPEVLTLLKQNSPGTIAPTVPIFIGHGDADGQVPVALSELLQDKYCALGATVELHMYSDLDHDEVIDAAGVDAMAFITDRYDHLPASTTC